MPFFLTFPNLFVLCCCWLSSLKTGIHQNNAVWNWRTSFRWTDFWRWIVNNSTALQSMTVYWNLVWLLYTVKTHVKAHPDPTDDWVMWAEQESLASSMVHTSQYEQDMRMRFLSKWESPQTNNGANICEDWTTSAYIMMNSCQAVQHLMPDMLVRSDQFSQYTLIYMNQIYINIYLPTYIFIKKKHFNMKKGGNSLIIYEWCNQLMSMFWIN